MELFISDLDGTLLNGNAEVTEFTRDTLNRLMAKGLNFTAATAPKSVKWELLILLTKLRNWTT